ncbi:hypothetical protein CY35_14G107500 [Sphagnum magellanicum]|nr:hypothetical protein CY35_14G107500 [Sphagnum magellanicum]KAH9542267.1 hypothetical protein CY35_14G107500 [Sphagnum magellanicum]
MAGRAHADAGSEGLPQANVKRVVKEKLAELAHAHFDDDRKEKDVLVNKDALLAFSESAKIFIHFLSATANEICRESKRQTINADDVLKAVEELDFPEFCEPLKAALAGFRKENDAKKQDSKRKEVARKRKAGDSNGTDGDIHVNGRLDEAVTMAEDEGFTD